MDFDFNLGDRVRDKITGFEGIVVARTQWFNNCNTYGVQPTALKDGMPQDRVPFDEPQLVLVKPAQMTPKRDTGGPERRVERTNR